MKGYSIGEQPVPLSTHEERFAGEDGERLCQGRDRVKKNLTEGAHVQEAAWQARLRMRAPGGIERLVVRAPKDTGPGTLRCQARL